MPLWREGARSGPALRSEHVSLDLSSFVSQILVVMVRPGMEGMEGGAFGDTSITVESSGSSLIILI